MGLVEIARQDYEAAASRIEKAIAIFERRDEDYLASALRVILGSVLLARGDDERAEREFGEGLEAARRLKVPSLNYIALYNLAQTALARGDREKAVRLIGEGIEWCRSTKDKANLAHFLEVLAAVVALKGEMERSAVLLGAVEGLLEEVGARIYSYYIPDRSLYARTVATVRSRLGEGASSRHRPREGPWTLSTQWGTRLGQDHQRRSCS